MKQRNYSIGPVIVRLTCDNHRQFTKLTELWQILFQMRAEETAEQSSTLAFHFAERPANATPLATATELWHYGRLHLWESAASFYLTCGAATLTIARGQAKAEGSLSPDFWACAVVEQREFFQLAFFLLLRQYGIYLLHTNGLVPPAYNATDGLLLIGDCGAGKTTLTLSLLTAGWRCVGDDQLMLQSRAAQFVKAYGLRRGFSCTEQTATAFPMLALAQTGPKLNREKTLLDLETSYPERFVSHCIPRILLFPQIVQTTSSRLVPLDATQTMLALLGQPRTGILVDPPTVRGHLDLLKALVQQAHGYQIALGSDVLDQPVRVSELLTNLAHRA